MRKVLLISSSLFKGQYLEHSRKELEELYKNVKTILFIPYALKDHDAYTAKLQGVFKPWGFEVEGLHTKPDPVKAVEEAEAIYVGGGNTFVLLSKLYELKLVERIHDVVVNRGVPYSGSSAGCNVATRSINTTNDMPIVQPPSFQALGLVPFNINPHYMETAQGATHSGETRDERIEQFIEFNRMPVLALPDGASLLVQGDKATLVGSSKAKLFKADGSTSQYEPNTDVSFLLSA